MLLVYAAHAESLVTGLVGVRGNPESSIERPDEPKLEPSATAAVVADTRVVHGALQLGGTAETWLYAPEVDVSLLRIAPRAGVLFDLGEHGAFDAGARYTVAWYPGTPEAGSGRAEASAAMGWHGIQLVATGVDRRYFETPLYDFSAAEAGLRGSTTRGAWSGGLRATGQLNLGRIGTSDGVQAVTGQQLRLGLDLSRYDTRGGIGVAYRVYVATGGGEEPYVRPQFTPLGDYDEDADVLSAGGFVQHRVSLRFQRFMGDWSLDTSALGRLRSLDGGDERSLHVAADLGRQLGEGLSAHAVVGTTWFDGSFETADPYGWVALRWKKSSAR